MIILILLKIAAVLILITILFLILFSWVIAVVSIVGEIRERLRFRVIEKSFKNKPTPINPEPKEESKSVYDTLLRESKYLSKEDAEILNENFWDLL